MDTYRDALAAAGDEPYIHFEDDVILCDNFAHKAQHEIFQHQDVVVQFFSRRKEDLTVGSRYINGGSFIFNVAYYSPLGFASKLLKFSHTWPRIKEHPTGCDLMVGDFMKSLKMRYWNVIPNPVDHACGKSLIDWRRSSHRQSKTFEKNRNMINAAEKEP